jgi:hypothetical protein
VRNAFKKVKSFSLSRNRHFKGCCQTNANQALQEENTLIRGCIGTSAEKDAPVIHAALDRIIYEWQTYAGRYGEKMIEKRLAAIRFFECKLEGKPFAKLSNADFATVRDEKKGLLRQKGLTFWTSLGSSNLHTTIALRLLIRRAISRLVLL